jgi:hypothetical protein
VHDLRLKLWNLYIRYLDVWARRSILVLGVCFIIFSCGNGIESLLKAFSCTLAYTHCRELTKSVGKLR